MNNTKNTCYMNNTKKHIWQVDPGFIRKHAGDEKK